MHLSYKQDYYKDKQKEIYDIFIQYLVPTMDNIEHLTLIEEWKENIDTAAYEKNLYRDVNIPSIRK